MLYFHTLCVNSDVTIHTICILSANSPPGHIPNKQPSEHRYCTSKIPTFDSCKYVFVCVEQLMIRFSYIFCFAPHFSLLSVLLVEAFYV